MGVVRRLARSVHWLFADDPFERANRRPTLEHLDDYRDWLMAKGRTAKQAREVHSRCRKMIGLCEFESLDRINAQTLEMEVAETVRGQWDCSLKTCNDYLKSMQQFCRWLAKPKIQRLPGNPLSDIQKYNAATDVRHPRRPLSSDEFARVWAVTQARPPYVTRRRCPKTQISGVDRAIYYLVKEQTGIRNLEARQLTPESFELEGQRPCVRVPACYSKHRREDRIPLSPACCLLLRRWLAGKPAGAALWPLDDKPYRMWKADLEAAGIAYVDAQGRFADLYSLRHRYGTEVGRRAPSMKAAQSMMRHSDPRLTARYQHVTLADEQVILRSLPVPGPPPGSDLFGGMQQAG